MMNYKVVFALLLSVVYCSAAPAQSIAEVSFEDVMKNIPRLPTRFTEAQEEYSSLAYGEMPASYQTAVEQMDETKKIVLKPLFNYFQASLKKANTDKTYRAKLSLDEQKMLRDFGTLDASWQDGAYYGFSRWIEYRPGITRQSWTKITQPLSTSGQALYQQLLQMEKALATATFLEECRPREALILSSPMLADLNKQRSEELDAVPMKKVKIFEGADATADVHDPDKSVEILKKYDEKIQSVYKLHYEKEYRWWNGQYNRISAIARKMDSILHATSFGENLSGNDRQLNPALADVQCRILEMFYHLGVAAARIAGIVPQSKSSKGMTEEYIRNIKNLSDQ